MTTYSNCLTSAPLTPDGIIATISDIADRQGRRVDIRPDTILVPPGFIESCIHAAVVDCERLIRKLSKPLIRGTQAQRRRRKAQGVVGRRHLRRIELRQELIRALKDLEFWESAGVEI